MTPKFQPLIPSPLGHNIEEKAFQLISDCNELKGRVHEITAKQIGDLVRVVNCYYSNLIEGHRTSLKDLEEARIDKTNETRLTLSKAHILTQEMVRRTCKEDIFSTEYICRIHGEFYRHLPPELKQIRTKDNSTIEDIVAGELRTRAVQVGGLVPLESNSEIKTYLNSWAATYRPLSRMNKVGLMGAIHHRLVWVHPFLDGNGRVARLLTDAMMMGLDLDHHGMWCLSRGLSRNRDQYMQVLREADESRYNDLDGRGALSQKNLIRCCEFFLDMALDQVSYMRSLYELNKIEDRYKFLMNELGLPRENADLLSQVFSKGELDRGEFVRLYPGKKERYARTQLSKLIELGLLTSNTPKGSIRVHFPMNFMEILMPKLM